MNRLHVVLPALLISTVMSSSYALPGDAVPNIFTANTTASAAQVNANFTEVVNQISTVNTATATNATDISNNTSNISTNTTNIAANANSITNLNTTYNYRDYGHTFTSKTFSNIGGSASFDTEIRTFDRTVAGQVSYLRDRYLSSARTQISKIYLDTSGPDLRFFKIEGIDSTDGTTVLGTTTITPGLIMRSETMKIGSTAAEAGILTYVPANPDSLWIQTSTLVGIEDVNVPAGSFTSCLKIHQQRASIWTRMQWICAGYGLVKEVMDNGNVLVLTSTTP